MSGQATRMARQGTQPPLGDVARLAEALGELRALATRERDTGSDAVAAYMLGRASRWPKAWLKRVMRERQGEFAAVGYDFDGRQQG